MEGTALPTGDLGDHSVLTGHTGLPSAKLFTDLDSVVMGDIFTVTVLNQIYTYEVIDIYVVLPTEMDNLNAQEGKNLTTLITCTPYGVNSHRLLVQGELVNQETIQTISSDSAGVMDTGIARNDGTTLAYWELIPLVVLAVLLILGGIFVVPLYRKRGRREKPRSSGDNKKS